jgi:hypothetical protein
MSNKSQFVTDALHKIVGQPEHDENQIARYFSPEYQQVVDGKSLDYRGFVEHMALLKSLTKAMKVSILAMACEENTVLTHHHVRVEKQKGQQSEIEVLARFTLSAGLIVRCDELTRLVSGAHDDHDLGSRR